MASVFPFGTLHAFGGHTFIANRSAVVTPVEEVVYTYAPVVGRVYPVSRSGQAVVSLGSSNTVGPIKVWEYNIIAQDFDPAAGSELLACETEYNAIRAFMTEVNGDGTSKSVDTLSVYSGDKTTLRTATAQLTKVEIKDWLWDYIQVEISWVLQTEFT